VNAFAKLLTELRKLFEGDLDQLLVLAVLAGGAGGTNWRKTLLDESFPRPFKTTNTQYIAEESGIPRESVRRKLQLMEAKGYIERLEDGSWKFRSEAAGMLRSGTVATMDYLVTVLNAGFAAAAQQPDDKAPDRD
jgi:hypothetical protein